MAYFKKSISEKTFDAINAITMITLSLITLYPFVYVLFGSFSNPSELVSHRGLLLYPLDFNLVSYKLVFKNPMILLGYRNTLIYLLSGTFVSIILTSLGAYALSRKNLLWKNAIMFMLVFTMFFSGGLIPSYLLVLKLGMFDSLWAIIIPGSVSTMNIIIMRTYFQTIPASMEESAKIDGANEIKILFRIILPLSIPVLAVMILFYGVGHWNSWFSASLYLRERKLLPLQLILREILITNELTGNSAVSSADDENFIYAETIKFATIIVATVPILFSYPFLQRYFIKGIMIGAIKE